MSELQEYILDLQKIFDIEARYISAQYIDEWNIYPNFSELCLTKNIFKTNKKRKK